MISAVSRVCHNQLNTMSVLEPPADRETAIGYFSVGRHGIDRYFKLAGKDHAANFVGQWAPTFLILGMYNKIVKLQGSDGA